MAAEVVCSYLFDFNQDIITVKIYDLNGREFEVGTFSLELYREHKDLPITLRIQIPPDKYEVNTNCKSLMFLDWTYKEVTVSEGE